MYSKKNNCEWTEAVQQTEIGFYFMCQRKAD